MRFNVAGATGAGASRAPDSERRPDADALRRPGFSPAMSLA
jgi:hypothetical protein